MKMLHLHAHDFAISEHKQRVNVKKEIQIFIFIFIFGVALYENEKIRSEARACATGFAVSGFGLRTFNFIAYF